MLKTQPVRHAFRVYPARGMSLSEYGLILGLITILAIPALMTQGTALDNQLNNTNQQISQLDQMTQLLQAPSTTAAGVSGKSSRLPSLTAGNEAESASSNTFKVNGSTFETTLGKDGLIHVVGAGSNTTSVEGSAATKLLASQFEDLAQDPTLNIPPDELKKLANMARTIASSQSKLANSNTLENYTELEKLTLDFQKTAKRYLDNSTLNTLNKTVLNISSQNYLNRYNNNLIYTSNKFLGFYRDKRKTSKEAFSLLDEFRIKEFSKEADSKDTKITAD